jgi:hypothetical protein
VPAYDLGFEPPAPGARVSVIGPSGTYDDVPMLLDSGADASLVPRHVVEAIGANLRRSSFQLELFDGTRIAAEEADVTLHLAPFRFGGTYLVEEKGYGIIGRNILRHVVLRLDGPAQGWSVARE